MAEARSLILFIAGIALFILGAYLVKDLIIKFIKFSAGIVLIIISIPMILGSARSGFSTKRVRIIRTQK